MFRFHYFDSSILLIQFDIWWSTEGMALHTVCIRILQPCIKHMHTIPLLRGCCRRAIRPKKMWRHNSCRTKSSKKAEDARHKPANSNDRAKIVRLREEELARNLNQIYCEGEFESNARRADSARAWGSEVLGMAKACIAIRERRTHIGTSRMLLDSKSFIYYCHKPWLGTYSRPLANLSLMLDTY